MSVFRVIRSWRAPISTRRESGCPPAPTGGANHINVGVSKINVCHVFDHMVYTPRGGRGASGRVTGGGRIAFRAYAFAVFVFLFTSTFTFAQNQAPATPPSAAGLESAYQSALPLYQYDAKQPLVAKYAKPTAFPGGRVATLTYRSVNDVRVPALLYLPSAASKAHPAACLVLLHGLGGNKEQLAPLGQFAAASGYAALIIDEYGHGERAPRNADGRRRRRSLIWT